MDLTAWLDQYNDAWTRFDIEALTDLFTPDALYQDKPDEPGWVGTAGVRDYFTQVTARQSDINCRFGTPLIQPPNRAAFEFWVNLTWSDEPTTLAGACLVEFAEDGRCRELREYYNVFPKKLEPSDNWGR